jgi:hypothetical protein
VAKEHFYFEVALGRTRSPRKALHALEYLVSWGRASDAAGRPLTVEEYQAVVGIGRSQAFRRQAMFRQAFPVDDVAAMWEIVRPVLDNETPFAKEKSVTAQAWIVGTFRWNP